MFVRDATAGVWNPMADAGVKYVRVPTQWKWIEAANNSPPTYNWSFMDQAFGDLADAGFTVIGEVYLHPSWASTEDCGPVDRVPLSRFGDFVEAMVERYDGDGTDDAPGSPRVPLYQFGNEPDFNTSRASGEPDYGSCFGGKPSDYGAYLREAYLSAKSADSSSTVLFGGIAYDRFYNKGGYTPTGPFDYPFVRNVLDWLYTNHGGESAWPFHDWMAVHVYNDYRNNWDGTQPYDQELLGKLKHFKNNQLFSLGKYDLRNQPLAVTEASLMSMPSDSYTERSEDLQAVYPGRLLARSMAADLRTTIWFSAEDHNYGNCFDIYDWMGVGLLRSMTVYDAAQACGVNNPIPDYVVTDDHEPKPVHEAYGVAVAQLSGASYDAQLTSGQTGSAQIEAYRYTRSGGGSMIVAFTDNGERLGRRGNPGPVTETMTFDSSILPGWTNSLLVVDHLGNETHMTGTSIIVTVTQAPVYVRPE